MLWKDFQLHWLTLRQASLQLQTNWKHTVTKRKNLRSWQRNIRMALIPIELNSFRLKPEMQMTLKKRSTPNTLMLLARKLKKPTYVMKKQNIMHSCGSSCWSSSYSSCSAAVSSPASNASAIEKRTTTSDITTARTDSSLTTTGKKNQNNPSSFTFVLEIPISKECRFSRPIEL